jgi:phosphoesterase RecJ-like protein
VSLPYTSLAQEFETLLQDHRAVTILSHLNPDPDAIGTALGIYLWLKEQGKRVEVVNKTVDIPRNLDFLPSFSKIKSKIDFDDSLIIACDSGSLDRLGFDLTGRTIVNIDHHPTNTHFGTLNIVDANAVASSEVAYYLLTPLRTLSAESATAFYAALVSDTRNFTTKNMRRSVFDLAGSLVDRGVNISYVTSHMLHRRSLASLRILGAAIDSLELVRDARVAVMTIGHDDRLKWGAKGSDLDGIVDYARSLVTVQVAVMIVKREEDIKVSLRSKGVDVARIAQRFGGGGHRVAAGFEMQGVESAFLRRAILDAIDEEELLL